MDLLSQLLTASELSGGMFARCEYRGSWMMDMCSEDAHMLFHIVKSGEAAFRYLGDAGDRESLTLTAGDVVILPFGCRHQLARGQAPAAPLLELDDDQLATFKTVLSEPAASGPTTTVLCGYYRSARRARHPLLNQLQPVMHVRAGSDTDQMLSVIALIDDESAALTDGSRVIMDRLAEALLLYLFRAWTRQQSASGGLLAALADPVLAKALAALHRHPERDWTVANLAQLAGASRAKFAKRFQQLIGCGPFQYLTELRMNRAALYLRDRQLPLTEVAERVGYRSEAAFAKVFKKATGVSPGRFRKKPAT